MIILDRKRRRIAERRQVAPVRRSAISRSKSKVSIDVRVAQTKVSRERAHIALPAVTAKSSPGRGSDTVTGGQIRRRREVVVPRWRLWLDPAESGRVPFGGGDVAAAHG